MNIAILGYGTVGSGVKEIIDHAVTKSTKQLHVSYILIRKGKAKTLPYMCDDIQTILQDTSVDVIVETMGGLEPAHTYILQALKSGKHVVTANKAVIAAYLKEFTDVAREHNVRIYYEASTGGGIPWIEGLAKAMRIDEVDRIHGIFNGTSNYILDHMQRYHASFEDILKEAQELGYAEADQALISTAMISATSCVFLPALLMTTMFRIPSRFSASAISRSRTYRIFHLWAMLYV